MKRSGYPNKEIGLKHLEHASAVEVEREEAISRAVENGWNRYDAVVRLITFDEQRDQAQKKP